MDVGSLIHRITLENPGALIPDGEGGFTQEWTPLSSRRPAAVRPATARDLERTVGNAVQSTASHLVSTWFLRGVTTKTRLIFHDPIAGDRTFAVTGMHDPDERHIELILACTETVL